MDHFSTNETTAEERVGEAGAAPPADAAGDPGLHDFDPDTGLPRGMHDDVPSPLDPRSTVDPPAGDAGTA